MDKRVFITLLGVIVLVGAILTFQRLNIKCEPPAIKFEPSNPVVGERVTFTITSATEDIITWDFGDSAVSSGPTAYHAYKLPRVYNVRAIIKEDCATPLEVNVGLPREMEIVIPSVSFPSVIHANEMVTFSEQTTDASVWNWKVNQTGETHQGQTFNPTFKNPGKYSVSVSINGKYVQGDTTFEVTVLKAMIDPSIEANRLKKEAEERAAIRARADAEARALKAKADAAARTEKERLAKEMDRQNREEAAKKNAELNEQKIAEAEKRAAEKKVRDEENALKKKEEAEKRAKEKSQFEQNFKDIANNLRPGPDASDASDLWANKILKNICDEKSSRVNLVKEDGETEDISVFTLRVYMNNAQYEVIHVENVNWITNKTSGDKCVQKITLKVNTLIKEDK
ncbi:MAG TPA: PKD domain-containing protein [Bacteroidia bacterium]|nr:PKD domain-containing protein [Bacteroidia bacterium]